MVRPSGTVTFLFTDIEGSTRRWDADPVGMRSALAAHDEVLRAAIESHGGWVFKHTGDGMCAAFSSAHAAVRAAVEAQVRLRLPVRMGITTGEVDSAGDDYFGPVVNRAARVMAAGHGGQVLVAATTAGLLSGVELVDLGEHRLRDLSGVEHLFQVRAAGLGEMFGPPRTLDVAPGNLPVQATSFVGRADAVKQVAELVRARPMVTLTGVGGVGKTRLAVHVAAGLTAEFPDGVWLAELAAVGDPAAVAGVVATTLGLTPEPERSLSATVANALVGRRMLVVLDNCEHVLDAAGELAETILGRASTVTVLATSREGLRLAAERVWPVPPLDVAAGFKSAAVDLFIERAQAVNPAFRLCSDADTSAVTEICVRLDGIPLAIELAAARMASMSPQEVRDRLGDRFRLLSASRRGVERHQTLRQAVGWSYGLLDDRERTVLQRVAVFADAFDLSSAVQLTNALDEYTVLDVLDALVRKSLVIAEQTAGHTRFRLLETIRRYAEEQLAASGKIDEVRDLHAAHFADQAVAHWELWDGPDQKVALDWFDAELANLRAAFRWASSRGELISAATIAAHGAVLGFGLLQFEPVAWAEELLAAATRADLVQLPRLYTAASLCYCIGRPDDGTAYARAAVELEARKNYEPFPHSLSRYWEALGHLYAGRAEQALALCTALARKAGPASVYGRCGQTHALGVLGRYPEAAAMADETLTDASALGNPWLIIHALYAHGLAYTTIDPDRALNSYLRGLKRTREQRIRFIETVFVRQIAHLATLHGDLDRALTLHDSVIESFHQSGTLTDLGLALLNVASTFRRLESPKVAATLFGSANQLTKISRGHGHLGDRLRETLGETRFERLAAVGAAMGPGEAVRYARQEIERARREQTTNDYIVQDR